MRRPPGKRARPLPVAFGAYVVAAVAAIAAVFATGCRKGPVCGGAACRATCPRDAVRDETGRCGCVPGDLLTLGACAPPAVGDAFCGSAARMRSDGCVFETCGGNGNGEEALDVATGACVPVAALARGGLGGCGDAGAPLVEDGRTECVPREAACPRGTKLEHGACARPPNCPAGTLASGSFGTASACQPLVTAGGASEASGASGTGARVRVDVGAWAALVFGVDGGPGSDVLCRPLAQRPAAFGVAPGQSLPLRLHLSLRVPDQDLTAVHADVDAEGDLQGGAMRRPLSPAAEDLVRAAVTSLVEPLRSLGGEASAAAVEVEVRCTIARL